MATHTLTLESDGNRMGSHYGEYRYIERLDGHVAKVEYLGRDYAAAAAWALSAAGTYGADFIDYGPRDCFSAD